MLSINKKSALGLDIGTSFVKLVELTQGFRKPDLTSMAIAPLPEGTIVDGLVSDKEALKSVIGDLIKSVNTSIKHVGIALSQGAVIVTKITIPEMSDDELNEHIIWEAEQYLPQELLEDVHIDYNKVNLSSRPGHMDVMLVAAKRSAVQGYSEVLDAESLVPKVVDVGSFALHRVFAHNYHVDPNENVMLLNIGSASTDMLIARDGNIIHAKAFEFGGKHFTEAISNQLGLDFQEAETHKVRQTLRDAYPAEFQGVIKSVLKDYTTSIQSALDFFFAHNDDTPISQIYITGGSSKLPGCCDYIQDALSINVEILDPFQNINYSKTVFQDKYINGVKPLSAIAIGLALRLLEVK